VRLNIKGIATCTPPAAIEMQALAIAKFELAALRHFYTVHVKNTYH